MASSGSSLTSITSSVLQGKMEDGRVYAVYGKEGRHAYPYLLVPVDVRTIDRE